jgi:hypothetical protein
MQAEATCREASSLAPTQIHTHVRGMETSKMAVVIIAVLLLMATVESSSASIDGGYLSSNLGARKLLACSNLGAACDPTASPSSCCTGTCIGSADYHVGVCT